MPSVVRSDAEINLALRFAASFGPSSLTSPKAFIDSVVLLTGELLILMFSVGSTKSCHLMSYAPTSPSNLFHPDGAMMRIPRAPS